MKYYKKVIEKRVDQGRLQGFTALHNCIYSNLVIEKRINIVKVVLISIFGVSGAKIKSQEEDITPPVAKYSAECSGKEAFIICLLT